MDLFHGTDKKTTKTIRNGKIDVSIGGGELGQGFYCGDLLWRAKQWAERRFGNTTVVKLVVNDDDFLSFDPFLLNKSEAIKYRYIIKQTGQQKAYKFDRNAIWSPVVGIPSSNFNQVKWESQDSQKYLNGSTVKRSIV